MRRRVLEEESDYEPEPRPARQERAAPVAALISTEKMKLDAMLATNHLKSKQWRSCC
jgi:hypothetical protein